MLYTEEAARNNIRTREGKRVFFLGQGDRLTSAAQDFLRREGIEILPAEAAKPQRAVTPVQSMVFYQGDVCLGGAVCAEVTDAGQVGTA